MNFNELEDSFLNEVAKGNNIILNGPPGSGKTSLLIHLCNESNPGKKVLFLASNRLLAKLAREKISHQEVEVTTFNGLANDYFRSINKKVPGKKLLSTYLELAPNLEGYDLILIDDYENLTHEEGELLKQLKDSRPSSQFIYAGNDKLKLADTGDFYLDFFLKENFPDITMIELDTSFRLDDRLAYGYNEAYNSFYMGDNELVSIQEMDLFRALYFIKENKDNHKNILCLGMDKLDLGYAFSELEKEDPFTYNRRNSYYAVKEAGGDFPFTPNEDGIIFTSYPSSIGLERDYVMVFDFSLEGYKGYLEKGLHDNELIKNMFILALTRAKKKLIFVKPTNAEKHFSFDYFKVDNPEGYLSNLNLLKFPFSSVFFNKNDENIYPILEELRIEKKENNLDPIELKNISPRYIDPSIYLNKYLKSIFFKNYDKKKEVELSSFINSKNPLLRRGPNNDEPGRNKDQKFALYLASLATNNPQYIEKVKSPFLEVEEEKLLLDRLKEKFSPEEEVNLLTKLEYYDQGIAFNYLGYIDLVKDNKAYSILYAKALRPIDYLDIALKAFINGLDKAIIYNLYDGNEYEISFKNKKGFIDKFGSFYFNKASNEFKRRPSRVAILATRNNSAHHLAAIGVAIADENFNLLDKGYYVIYAQTMSYQYSYEGKLFPDDVTTHLEARNLLLGEIKELMDQYEVDTFLAYEAYKELNRVKELSYFYWADIYKIARNRFHNPNLPKDTPTLPSGNSIRDYELADMIRIMTNDPNFELKDNAIDDAIDILKLLKAINRPIEYYQSFALIPHGFGREVGDRKPSGLNNLDY